jgi:uncharacterized protein DUF6128
MADYKRLVSYMYNYEDGMKKNNVGYARVESRNGQCKVTVHITTPSLNEKELKVYFFKRDGYSIEGILLGNVAVRNGIAHYRGVTNANHIMNSPFGLDDMGGMVLYWEDKKYFATEWDDKPITKEMVYVLEHPPKKNEKKSEEDNVKSHKEVESKEEENQADEQSEPTLIQEEIKDEENNKEKMEEEINEKSTREEALPIEEVKNVESSKEEIKKEEIKKEEVKKEEVNREEKEKAPERTIEQEDVPEKTAKSDKGDIKSNEEGYAQAENIEKYNGMKLKEPIKNVKTNIPQRENKRRSWPAFEEHPMALQIYNRYPKMYPFEDNEVAWCVRFEPQDIGILPMDAWGYGNNSFLLHGFYCYSHLVFARINDKNGIQYILGVPGIYHNREKFMAKMFGFDFFKSIKRKELRTGEFGYWYTPIYLN